jgi:hypothetical protein
MTSDAEKSGVNENAPAVPAGASAPNFEAAQSPTGHPAAPQPGPEIVAAPAAYQPPAEQPIMSEPVYAKPRKGPVRRFIRSLISHLVFAAIVTAAAFGYVYQKEIFGRLGDELCTDDRLGGYMTKARAPVALEPVKAARSGDGNIAPATVAAKGATPSTPVVLAPSIPAVPAAAPAPGETKTVAKVEPSTTIAPKPEPTAVKAITEPSETRPVAAAPVAPKPTVRDVPAATPVAASDAGSAQARSVPVPASPSASAVSDAPRQAALSSAPDTAAATTAATADATKDATSGLMAEWQSARQKYSANKDEAVEAYRSLIARHPMIAELRGELGNVYYGLGRMKEAAEQYYEAALRHLQGPDPGVASCLADVIQRIDPARAEALKDKTTKPCPYRRTQ